MKVRKEHIALLAIFMAVFLFRLYFAFQTPTFTPESYFDIRQIINIRFFWEPIYHDDLSFSGREFFFLPTFHYIIAAISLLFPLQLVLKIAPNFFASLTVIIVYLIASELTKSRIAALAASFSAGFIPIFIFKTVNSVSVYSVLIPLFFFLIYCIMRIEERIFLWSFITGLLILIFLHPFSMLLIIGLLFYIAFVKLEQIKYNPAEAEVILFSTLLATWMSFLMFKAPLLMHGPMLIWQNIPEPVLENYFAGFNALQDILRIGVIPFLAGLFIIYRYVLREHVKSIYLFGGFAFAVLVLLWLRLINLDIGLIFLGIILAILLSELVLISLNYLDNTKFSQHRNFFIISIFLLLLLTSGISSFKMARSSIDGTPSENEIKALLWLKANSDSESIVLSGINEGHLITGIAQRKNVADSNFLMVNDAGQRVNDIETIYSTSYKIEAIKLLNRYNADYIFLSKKTDKQYSGALKYANDKTCFELAFENKDAQIYKSLCRV